MMEVYSKLYVIFKCSFNYFISAVISSHNKIMETSKFIFFVFCSKYCSQGIFFLFVVREMREEMKLVSCDVGHV